MSQIKKMNKQDDILLSLLEFLDRNGYKYPFEKLVQKTGINYYKNEKKILEDLLYFGKIDELILYVRNNSKIKSEEKSLYIKLLKIRKYIELITKNCSDRIDQKDSLYYLRTEISPLLNSEGEKSKNLLTSLTILLFFKDMNLLQDYIKQNL